MQFSTVFLEKYFLISSPLRKSLLENVILKKKMGAQNNKLGAWVLPMGRTGSLVGRGFHKFTRSGGGGGQGVSSLRH